MMNEMNMMRAKCKYYRLSIVMSNLCSSYYCPGKEYIRSKYFYCLEGIIYFEWVSYIKHYSKFDEFFNFEDIIYDK